MEQEGNRRDSENIKRKKLVARFGRNQKGRLKKKKKPTLSFVNVTNSTKHEKVGRGGQFHLLKKNLEGDTHPRGDNSLLKLDNAIYSVEQYKGF